MAASESMSIEVREATIAAIVAGAVVIVLGYASGLGLHVPLIQAATVRPAPAVSTPLTVPQPARVLLAVPAFVTNRPVAPAAPVLTYPHPSAPPPAPVPTPAVTPAPAPHACTPGLLSGLLAPLDSLLGGLLGSSLVPTSGATPAPTSSGSLGCTLDGLLGSTCCDSATRTAIKVAAR